MYEELGNYPTISNVSLFPYLQTRYGYDSFGFPDEEVNANFELEVKVEGVVCSASMDIDLSDFPYVSSGWANYRWIDLTDVSEILTDGSATEFAYFNDRDMTASPSAWTAPSSPSQDDTYQYWNSGARMNGGLLMYELSWD